VDDIYEALIGGGADPRELAQALRRQQQVGSLGQVSGVKALQQAGTGQVTDAQNTVQGLMKARQAQELQNQRNCGKSAGGGMTGILQVAERYMAEDPNLSFDEAASKAAFAMRNNYSIKDIAGVQHLVGSVPGSTTALTSIDEVEGNAARIKAAEAEGAVVGDTEAKRFYNAPKARAALDAVISNYRDTIRKATEIRDDPALGRVTGLMAFVPSVWGGQAANLEAGIENLKIGLGFDRLQQMRDASPTGGALGQVSEREGEWLQNATESLARSQSKEQFVERLNRIIERMRTFEQRAMEAYQQDFGVQRSLRGGPALPKATGAARPSIEERMKALGL
jgi:hypothetical protein